ncbi:site-specific DNA-methyltransferase [Allochromatium tepidum]|uniref:site-specific DNA-methyltransferase (adenine-specific) n=1 Tax=Allochromatium tepidum TaxID=553982 RepID=A0ABN6G7Y7_9GAMM|nr:site-specific DNA-methyltransferase [Allochromatium tepidum]BCU06051.1 hypothetical protein Atep_07280 [Allochromatium tepidum]
MKKLTANDPETKSPDLVAENIARFKALFPELVTEGPDGAAVNVDVLKQLVGDKTVTDCDEKYGLNWHGKRRARQLALTPSTGTLRPCPEDSVDWDTTQNLMIEGDNLEVLKLLQKSYAGKVKLIYIDPPYNTGRDFIYKDDFRDNIRNYKRLTGQVDDEGSPLTSNPDTSGRFHTDWLNMMYPRLKVAHALLRRDGVLFVSCDDNEVANLRIVLDEIFGAENFIASVIWQKIYSPKNAARHFSEDHDYILVYARSTETWRPRLLPRTEAMEARYDNPDNDPRGLWMSDNLTARNYYSEGVYPVTCPSGRVIEGPPPGTYWRVSKEKFEELDRDNRIWWGQDGNNMPRLKRFLSEVQQGRVPQTLWSYKEVGHTQDAKKELLELVHFEHRDNVLDTVKPTSLVRRMLQIATAPEDGNIVLDFFAGSGPTGHAVLEQNRQDGGNRRFVLVQIPEPLPKPETHLRTLADITKERLRRAGKKLKEEHPDWDGDTGFRVFKLDSSNIRAWEPDRHNLDQTLLDHVEHIKEGRTEQDILYELLLKLGLDLCVPIETRTIAGKAVHSIGGGVLLACLATEITREEVEPLAQGIVAWHQALAPAADTTCVFRDSAFADDVAKTNLAAILEQAGIANVRSL